MKGRMYCPLPDCGRPIQPERDTLPLYRCERGHVTNYPLFYDPDEARRERLREVLPLPVEMAAREEG